jgi:hypothetical protein
MTTRLAPYGSELHAHNVAKVGKPKAPPSLASRMPSPEIATKVGVADGVTSGARARRVVRRNERG